MKLFLYVLLAAGVLFDLAAGAYLLKLVNERRQAMAAQGPNQVHAEPAKRLSLSNSLLLRRK